MVEAAQLKAREDITVLVIGLDNSSWLVERICVWKVCKVD